MKQGRNLFVAATAAEAKAAAETFQKPRRAGHYWAKLVNPTRMPAGEDWASVDWEVVQVFDNYGEGDEEFGVHVPGVPFVQWLPNFTWGPAVMKPATLGGRHGE